MCGIAGIAALDPRREIAPELVAPMLSCLAHRGPDDEGMFSTDGAVLGHRRLSIIDLESGHQPLFGVTEETAIICNGEIYNYRDLREQLSQSGHRFRTHSDTEVAAHAYDRWGLDFLDRLDGMFALALWDARRRRLVLARDRMGEKPLYYAIADGFLVFASELTSLRAYSGIRSDLDLRSLSQYLALEYVPAPNTILRGVQKLEPGQALVLEDGKTRLFTYWQLDGRRTIEKLDYGEAVTRLRTLLDDAVKSRLVSDVPLGVFLSGGIDSSTIAALAARHGALDTFAIGFREPTFDESQHALRVAAHIGSRHRDRLLRAEEMPNLVPRLPMILDEPLGDASIIPTTLLSSFAREHVTVALGGDGGDELFAGYPMHQAHRLARYARIAPGPMRALMQQGVRALPMRHTNFSLRFKAEIFLKGAVLPPPLNHAQWMSSFTPEHQRQLLTPEVWMELGREFDPFEPIQQAWQRTAGAPLLGRATMLDALTYLPNDILMKVDRASMHVGLEVRAPFLARAVTEFAYSLPDAFRMKWLTGKRLIRDAVRDLLPREILHRPKKGFGIPVAAWLNGPLRPLVNDLLASDSIGQSGLFRAEHVHRLVREHAEGRADHRKPLWTLLVFELWRRHHLRNRKPEPLSIGIA
jgi:asparagine synthase (glutamine-hydrolysing)